MLSHPHTFGFAELGCQHVVKYCRLQCLPKHCVRRPLYATERGLADGDSFKDANVTTGQTYYYVTTAVDTSNNQSAYSNQAQATVPSP